MPAHLTLFTFQIVLRVASSTETAVSPPSLESKTAAYGCACASTQVCVYLYLHVHVRVLACDTYEPRSLPLEKSELHSNFSRGLGTRLAFTVKLLMSGTVCLL